MLAFVYRWLRADCRLGDGFPPPFFVSSHIELFMYVCVVFTRKWGVFGPVVGALPERNAAEEGVSCAGGPPSNTAI